MLDRLKQNAEKFFEDAEKLRKETEARNEKSARSSVSPSNKAAGDSTKVVKGALTPEKDKKAVNDATDPNKKKPAAESQQKQSNDKSTVNKDEKKVAPREDKVKAKASEKVKVGKNTSSNNNVVYGVAAAAAVGLGLFVAYKLYQGQSIDVISPDIPVKPEI